MASGLHINLEKTKGRFFNKRNILSLSQLPNIEWSNELAVLKINYGPSDWQQKQWNDIFASMEVAHTSHI